MSMMLQMLFVPMMPMNYGHAGDDDDSDAFHDVDDVGDNENFVIAGTWCCCEVLMNLGPRSPKTCDTRD